MSSHIYHDSPKKNRFIGAIQAGQSLTEAANNFNIPKQTASDLWKKFQKTGSTHARPRSGRPSKISARMKRTIVREARANRRKPLHEIGKFVTPNISASSVRTILHEVGLHRRKARKVVYLRKDQKESRNRWAKDHRSWTTEDWMRVIWSDECYVYIGDNRGTVWVTRAVDEEFDENCVVPTFKQSSVRVMIWACIMKGSKGPMVVLEYPGGRGGGMTADRYQDQVLDKVLFDYYVQMSEERGQVVFQQDGASCHRAKSTLAWLKRNEIEIFPHPSSSPDLSPIEPLWHWLKTIIRARSHPPTRLDELKAAVRDAWDQITEEDIEAHVKHMKDRVSAVLKANGGHTKY
jgi:transposase